MTDLQRFEGFLQGVDIAAYRAQYAHIKIVELDMDRNIQALHHLYNLYWERRAGFPDYPSFYETYESDLRSDLEEFRRGCLFSEETFYRGLPARIYRTWAALLTQIQGAYVAEEIYGRGNVKMSVNEDHRGKDFHIKIREDAWIGVQIKKETHSREVRAPRRRQRSGREIIDVIYAVPGCDPRTPTGRVSVPYTRWEGLWGDRLKRLDNGFIVFRHAMFEISNLLPVVAPPAVER